MLRSLNTKLVLAFVIVGLVGVAVVAAFVGARTTAGFDNYMRDRWSAYVYDLAAAHYEAYGSWDGIDVSLRRGAVFWADRVAVAPGQADPNSSLEQPDASWQRLGPPMLQQGRRDQMDRLRLIQLVGPNGMALISGLDYTPGDLVPDKLVRSGVPVLVGEQQVGTLIIQDDSPRGIRDLWEHAFLGDFVRALLAGAGGAVVLALLIGWLLARSISRPVRELTAATQTMAGGSLGQQIPVRSQDELGQLAASFNQMSSDLASAEHQRKQMTADIAHELRTPLSLILGHAEALSDGVLPPSAETFEIIHDEAQRLTRLIEDLRTLSLSEAGELALEMELTPARALLERAAAVHSPHALAKHISIILELPPALPDVAVDSHRMAQVLDNLLTNALRYTPQGGTIRLGADHDEHKLYLAVQDSGPGIPQSELEHLFDRFYRSDKSRQRLEGGSGLGLAIARSIVASHGGELEVQSPPGEGAKFIIALPAIV